MQASRSQLLRSFSSFAALFALGCCALALPFASVVAQTTWTATTDSTWSTPTNWSAGEPTLLIDAILPTPIPVDGATLTLSNGEQARSLTFNASGYILNSGTLELGSPGNITVTNALHTATINSLLTGTSGLTKLGAGNLTLGSANSYTGLTRVLNGTLTLASGSSIGVASTPGSLQVAERTTATLIAQAGSQLSVGSGAADFLHVGSRGNIAGSAATTGTLNLSALNNFTANVGEFHIGVGTTSGSGTTRGIVNLATNNTINASTAIIVGDMVPALDNSAVGNTSQLNFGSGNNTITTPTLVIGGSRTRATSTLAAGGTLTLNNGASSTDLHIGRQNVENTATSSEGNLDLGNGTFIATLDELTIGTRTSGAQANTGSATGTLTIGTSVTNNITANTLTLGSHGSGVGGTSQGTLNFAGGTFTVANDITLANHTANGGNARGTLNLTGGTFTVDGNITKTDKTTATAVIIIDGANVDMTGGSITSSQLAVRSGTLGNVTSVTLDAHATTTGTGNTADALIIRDYNLAFDIALTGATTSNVHYEATTPTASGATLSGNLNLGNAIRTFNIEDNALAPIDLDITGIITSTGTSGGLNKTNTGTLRLSNANTHTGPTTVSDGLLILNHALAVQNSTLTVNTPTGLQFASTITNFTLGGLAGNTTASITLNDSAAQPVNLTIGQNNAATTYSGTISGSGTLTKTGNGILTLAGPDANTYTGLTTVNGGSILLAKTSNTDAISGDLLLTNGGDLRFSGNTNQLADTTNITINGNDSTFNGTSTNANIAIPIETIASLTVTRGVVNSGPTGSQITVTGATAYTGTTGTAPGNSTMYIGNSGGQFQTHSLSLTDMTGLGDVDKANSFTVFGNSNTLQSTLHVGPGGLTLNNSNLHLFKATSSVNLGSRLILDGNLTVNGSTPSAILTTTGTFAQSEIELSSTTGTVNRTIETNADLTINPDINNGNATTAGITKTGAAKLTLAGNNSYTGQTQINGGTLAFLTSANLGDSTATANTIGINNATLQYNDSITTNLGTNRDLILSTGTATIDTAFTNGNLILSGDITGSGPGTFTKTGAGTLTLAGTDLSGLNNRGLDLDQGTLSFVNHIGTAINLGTAPLSLGNNTALAFDIGSLTNFDSINTTAVATLDPDANITLLVTALADITPNTTYNLVTAGTGSNFDDPTYTWNLSLAGSYQYQLNLTDTQVQLQTLAAITGDAWWQGDLPTSSWSSIILGPTNNTNWATDNTGTTDREAGPGPDTTVYFSTTNATGPTITTTLDNNFTINDLIFTPNPNPVTSVTIAQGTTGTLTLNPTDPTTGIQVQDNAGTITITAPLQLGADQTWNVSNLAASLAVSGPISGGSTTDLTKTGLGTLTLTGTNTHTGRTIVNEGTLVINSEAALGANPDTPTPDQLTLNGGTLQTTATFAINDPNRGITLGTSSGTFNTNNGTTLTVDAIITGTGNLTKSGGTGALVFSKANTYTGITTLLTGTTTIANGGSIGVATPTANSLQIADRSSATLNVQAGGDLKVGNGSSSYLYVGTRTTDAGTAATTGTMNLSASTNFTANVGKFYIGVADTASATGTTQGIVTLAQNNDIIASTEILVGQMTPALGNTGVTSQLNFGSGINNITTPSLTIGSRKSAATSTIATGGTLNLSNGAGKTNLYLGRNNNTGTSTHATGTLNLTNGTFNATLGIVIIGERSGNDGTSTGSGGAGSGTGTLTLGTANHNITADTLILGNLLVAGSTTTTQGTLNMAGGTFTIATNIGLGIHTSGTAGTLAQGTINLTGGTLIVGGNITTANKTDSTSIVTVNGGTLDMTDGTINADTLNAQSGALKDVAQINTGDSATPAALTKTTGGNLLLLGTNSYTGATLVNEGVLEVRGTSGTGTTTILNTATLAGAGTIQSTTGTTIQTGGQLKAGNNLGDDIGTLTFNSDLTLDTGSITTFQLSAATGTFTDPLAIDPTFLNGTPANHDHIDITGTLNLATDTTIKIDLLNYIPNYGDVFNLFDWTIAGNALPNGFDPDTDFDFTNAVLNDGQTWARDRFLSDGVIYVVPEPSRALLILLGSTLLNLTRRRRTSK
ncbi:PEP-CTERM sorting domain-containing protein [Phragmitibacter flavus]|uniref:PEP-CTERM sorting domain-containing protein n=1 Tax=Phragmitibacter flavus TaxID=2576071 RepID=A0A5R8KGU0_9BACT|nr:autotransporter-associated beta strand repeat-containing protein [Phragmitibacter flavus]TLD71185.1 PEP-CTERM sorting domain-containing protein [Phragmitibacter flavus]